MSIRVYLSLGSNQGDRRTHLESALVFLSTTGEVRSQSRIFRTKPIGMAPGSEEFYNMAVCLQTDLTPVVLLERIKEFESRMGRDLECSHNQPRTIDIDILLVESITSGFHLINTPFLQIPHKEMANRAFVLVPLSEIAPHTLHPVLNRTITQLAAELEISDGLIAPLNGDPCDS